LWQDRTQTALNTTYTRSGVGVWREGPLLLRSRTCSPNSILWR
jgi:hypothetical protein